MGKFETAKLVMLALICATVVGCGGGGSSSGTSGSSSYQVSGSVRSGNTGVAGVTVTLVGTGTTRQAVTDASGAYQFIGLSNGSYSVTGTKKDYSCSPRSESVSVNGADVAAPAFSAAPSSTIFYVIDDANHLAKLDIAARTVEIVGDTHTFLNDIAFDPSGNLYGISGDRLYRIDPATAQVTEVGPLGITQVTSLEFNPSGTLYTANTSLCSVNPATGAATVIGGGGDIAYNSSGDLVFLGNQLFLTSTFNQSGNALVRLDPATGVATLVGGIGMADVFGLSTNDQVTLYGFSGTKVLTINPTTGVGALFWDTLGASGLTAINGAAAR